MSQPPAGAPEASSPGPRESSSGTRESFPGTRESSPGTRVSDYEYELPPGRIAAYPAERRDESRLLAVSREGNSFRHLRFREIVDLFDPGDLLVVNESRVLPARLLGEKPTGAPSEILLLRPVGSRQNASGGERAPGARDVLAEGARDLRLWEALVRPGGKLKPGRRVVVSSDLEVAIVDSTPAGGRIVRLESSLPVEEVLARHGQMPLPPYLDREEEPLDRERYQTVYARTSGSVAAPTAGLHFTPDLLDELREKGVGIARILLHVGVGTFRPVEVEDPSQHPMHREVYTVPEAAAESVNRTRENGGRIWAVGTTVVRTLETVADKAGRLCPARGSTDLFIRPPYQFRSVDALVTNFHLPRSTLLMLVAAFGGYDRIMEAYREAIREGYRFYSYGDAMAIL